MKTNAHFSWPLDYERWREMWRRSKNVEMNLDTAGWTACATAAESSVSDED